MTRQPLISPRRDSVPARLRRALDTALAAIGDWLAPPRGGLLQPIPVRATRRPAQRPRDV